MSEQGEETSELSKLDKAVIHRLKDSFTEDENIIGYFEEFDTFNVITAEMKAYGYTFSVRDSDYRKRKPKTAENGETKDDVSIDPSQNIFYHLKAMSIKFFGLPFTVEKTTNYQCTFGCKYYKSRAGRTKPDDSGHPLLAKKRRNVISKKVGCLAKMTLKKITVYPEYELDALKDWRKKKGLITKLREDLTSSADSVKRLCRYYLCFSVQSRHNHPPEFKYDEVPKPKRSSGSSVRAGGKSKKKEPVEDEGNWVTLYPESKDDEGVREEARPMEVQDAFFNSLVKFPATTVAYSQLKPITVELGPYAEVESVEGQEDTRTYQLEAIQYPSAQDLQTLFKEKLKRLYTLSENCNNTALLGRLISELEQVDFALVQDIGFDAAM